PAGRDRTGLHPVAGLLHHAAVARRGPDDLRLHAGPAQCGHVFELGRGQFHRRGPAHHRRTAFLADRPGLRGRAPVRSPMMAHHSFEPSTLVPWWRRSWLIILGILALIFLIAPILIVMPMSFSGSRYLRFPP